MDKIKLDKRNYRKHNDRNKRLIKKSLEECGVGRSIVIDNENEIIAGNGVFEQARKLDMPIKVIETDGNQLIAIKRTDLATNDEKRKKLAILDNSTSDLSEFDYDLLKEDFNVDYLNDLGIELDKELEDNKESKYTRKITLPIYEIKGENPEICELVDSSKADLLIDKIEKMNIDNSLKDFLKKSATRLYEFNYSKIAEYYAHQNKDTQEIMEQLALVLIDLNKAVEYGYVELNKFIEETFLEEVKNRVE